MKKRYLLVMPILVLAGCGDVHWFPDPKVITPTTDTQSSTSATDSTGTVTAKNLVVSEVSRDASFVTISLKADVVNSGTQGTVVVFAAGKNKQGMELHSPTISGPVAAGETKSLTDTSLVSLPIFQNISTWTIKSVSKL